MVHFEGLLGAATCDLPGREMTAKLVGAKHTHEVAILNGLTVNLHLLMMAFYRPTETRFKIMIEGGAFPSDRVSLSADC